jgi:hypothetical protein
MNETSSSDGSQVEVKPETQSNSGQSESSLNSAHHARDGSEKQKAVSDLLRESFTKEVPDGDDPAKIERDDAEYRADNPEPDGVADPIDGVSDPVVLEPKGLTPKGLAEKLDIEAKDIYGMEITTGDGEVTTLQKLKDSFEGQATTGRETTEREIALNGREAAITSDIQALGVLDAMQAIPQNIRTQAVEHMNAMAEREYLKFRSVNPELQTDEGRLGFEADVGKHLKQFGLIKEQFGVQNVGMMRMIQSAIRNEKAIAKLTALKPKKAPSSVNRNRTAPIKADSNAAIVQQAMNGTRNQKSAAVAQLLKGNKQ